MKIYSLFVPLCVLLGGCSMFERKAPTALAPIMSIQSAPIESTRSSAAAAPAAQPYYSENAALPVYSQPIIRRINLEPYVDENGNAYGPQIKYVLDKQADWNLDAIRNPSKAFVPQAMSPVVAAPASVTTPNTGQNVVAQPTRTLRDVYNIKDVTVTGFVERSQEPLAREMAQRSGENKFPFYDEQLGWILLPASALQPPAQGR